MKKKIISRGTAVAMSAIIAASVVAPALGTVSAMAAEKKSAVYLISRVDTSVDNGESSSSMNLKYTDDGLIRKVISDSNIEKRTYKKGLGLRKVKNFDRNGKLQNYTTYYYQSAGVVSSFIMQGADDAYLLKESYTYSSDGKVKTSERKYYANGTQKKKTYISKYAYKSNGNIKISLYNGKGKLLNVTIQKYNDKGDLSGYTVKKASGKVIETAKYTLTYDASNRLTSVKKKVVTANSTDTVQMKFTYTKMMLTKKQKKDAMLYQQAESFYM